jgi:hypothetical protein
LVQRPTSRRNFVATRFEPAMHGKRAADLLDELRKSKWISPYSVRCYV